MNKIVTELKKSPLFNLSLSSKELFHSNFIYWVAERSGSASLAAFGEEIKSIFPEIPKDLKCTNIEREKTNLDLKFQFSSEGKKHFLVIENKVKSSIYLNQLEKYSKGNQESTTFAVLALKKPQLFQKRESINVNGYTWHYFSYKSLLKLLENFVEFNSISEYERNIIEDYIGFTNNLIEISNRISVNENDKFTHFNNDDLSELRTIKLHDLYLKKVYEEFAFKIHQKLKDNFSDILTPFGETWFAEGKNIFVGHGFTRSTGILEVKYKVTPSFLLGIQIQHNSYKILIESFKASKSSNPPKTAMKIKERLDKEKLWFDLSKIDDNTYPRGNKGFNKYGNTFFYKSVKLHSELSIKEIIDYVISDIKLIHSRQDQIRLIVENYE